MDSTARKKNSFSRKLSLRRDGVEQIIIQTLCIVVIQVAAEHAQEKIIELLLNAMTDVDVNAKGRMR